MKKRYYEIDIMRFIAAILVVLFHYTFRGANGKEFLTNVKYENLDSWTRYGYLGVDLFFMISGFVIILSAEESNFIKFFLSRAVRLFPAYMFCVTLTAIVLQVTDSDIINFNFLDYLLNLTMLNGFVGINNIDGSYWSLAVELRFYLLISILLLLKLNKVKNFEYFIIIWLIITIVLNTTSLKSVLIFKIVAFLLVTDYSSYFIAGISFFLISKNGLCTKKLVIVITSLIMSLFNSLKMMDELIVNFNVNYNPLVICTTIFLFYFIFLMVSLNKIKISKTPEIVLLGAITYPLYLIHQNIGYVLINKLEFFLNKHILLLLLFSLMVFLAYLINKFIENRLRKFINRRILGYNSKDVKN